MTDNVNRKRLIRFVRNALPVVLIAALLILSMIPIFGHAAPPLLGPGHSVAEYKQDLIDNYNPFQASAFEVKCTADGYGSLQTGFTATSMMSSSFSSLINAAATGYEGVKVVGIIFLVLYFFLDIMDKVQLDRLSTDVMVRKLLNLVIALIIIMNGADLFKKIIRFGDVLTGETEIALQNNLLYIEPENPDSAYQSYLYLADAGFAGWIKAVGQYVSAGIPAGAQFIAMAVAAWAMVTRIIKITLRFLFAPIGIAPIVNDGLHSSGANYIRRFAADCIEGTIVVATLVIVPTIARTAADAIKPMAMILVPIAEIGAISKAGHLASEIMGVNRIT